MFLKLGKKFFSLHPIIFALALACTVETEHESDEIMT